jgi:hypothetical protein
MSKIAAKMGELNMGPAQRPASKPQVRSQPAGLAGEAQAGHARFTQPAGRALRLPGGGSCGTGTSRPASALPACLAVCAKAYSEQRAGQLLEAPHPRRHAAGALGRPNALMFCKQARPLRRPAPTSDPLGGPAACRGRPWFAGSAWGACGPHRAASRARSPGRRARGQAKPSSLHAAAKAGDAEALRDLLGGGADSDATDARGISALGVAVGFNRLPAVRALLAGGAAVGQRDGRGNTVLHYAAGARARARPTRAPACNRLRQPASPFWLQGVTALCGGGNGRRTAVSPEPAEPYVHSVLSTGLPGKEHHRG